MNSWTEKIRRGERLPLPLDCLLQSLTPAYRLGMWLRKRKSVTKVDALVISIGNLTAGGTGKTPAVIYFAKEYVKDGRKVGVLTRGYGAANRGNAVSSELSPEEFCDRLGDEPALILQQVPEAIVFKSADRIASAKKAISEYNCDVLILDDGYQYVQLHRDRNILLIDAANPFGSGHILPRGILREPVSASIRATEVILTRCDSVSENLDEIGREIARHNPKVPVRKTIHRPVHFRRVVDGKIIPLESMRGEEIDAACAIGNPEAFRHTLISLQVDLARFQAYKDHQSIPKAILESEKKLVVTEKDAVKITNPSENLYVLEIELSPYRQS